MSKKPKKAKSRNSNTSKQLHRRRRALGVFALILLLSIGLAGLLALQYFVRETIPQNQTETISVSLYFRNTEGHWEQELRQIEVTDNTVMISDVLRKLKEGPANTALLPSIPENVSILGANLILGDYVNTLEINLSGTFNEAAPLERIFATSSLVYSLTDLDFVDYLIFYVEDEPMLDGDGNIFGLRSRENTNLEDNLPPREETDEVLVILYFPDEQMMGLVAETRGISINPLQDIERFIVDALIAGPETAGLYPSFPPGVSYNRVERTGDMVTVDFPQDFYSHLAGGSLAEEMMIFSLVNTLTERPEIRRVQILIAGLPIQLDEGAWHMDLSRPIERDESLIIGE